jgi:WS/DGAT/MGAT family acyltransferase
MQRLTPLDAQFLNVETPTTVGHVGSLIVLDPPDAPGVEWNLELVRSVFEPRLHLAAPLRRRLVEVPLGLGHPYWVDDPHFDIEFHLRELALPSPGTDEQLGEQVARIHSRQLDRSRPLWEAYVITGLQGGRCAFYSKIHHAAIDGVSGAEILETIMDLTPEPRDVAPEDAPFVPRQMPSTLNLVGRGLSQLATNPTGLLSTLPQSLQYVDQLPGAGNLPGARLVSSYAGLMSQAFGGPARQRIDTRQLKAPRTPLNGTITAHRRFAFGSVPLSDVKLVKNHFGMTVNDVVMALTATALRRWLLDHDALPQIPLVAAVPVSIRAEDQSGAHGNQISVMLAELPTHLRDPEERIHFMRSSMQDAKRAFDAVPASLLQDLSALVPTALSGLAARALFRLATMPGVPFNLFVSNVPGPQLPLYIAGARVRGIHPVSGVTDLTGGLNITLFSYDGSLDFGMIACREMVPDVWHLIGYVQDAMAEMLALLPSEAPKKTAAKKTAAKKTAAKKTAAKKTAAKKTPARKTSASGERPTRKRP